MKHVNRRAQSSVQGWRSYLKYVVLELTSLEFMRFDSIIIILLSLITLDMSVILLFNVNVTPDEAHLMYGLNDACLKGLQSPSSVVNYLCSCHFVGFVSFHVQRLT